MGQNQENWNAEMDERDFTRGAGDSFKVFFSRGTPRRHGAGPPGSGPICGARFPRARWAALPPSRARSNLLGQEPASVNDPTSRKSLYSLTGNDQSPIDPARLSLRHSGTMERTLAETPEWRLTSSPLGGARYRIPVL